MKGSRPRQANRERLARFRSSWGVGGDRRRGAADGALDRRLQSESSNDDAAADDCEDQSILGGRGTRLAETNVFEKLHHYITPLTLHAMTQRAHTHCNRMAAVLGTIGFF